MLSNYKASTRELYMEILPESKGMRNDIQSTLPFYDIKSD